MFRLFNGLCSSDMSAYQVPAWEVKNSNFWANLMKNLAHLVQGGKLRLNCHANSQALANSAMTLNIMTSSIMTFSITVKEVTLGNTLFLCCCI